MTHPHPNRRFVPQAVLTRSGKINTASASVNTAGVSVNTVVRPINTAGSKPTVNHPRPISNEGYSQVTRPFNKYSEYKNSIFNKMVNTIKVKDTTAKDRAVIHVYNGLDPQKSLILLFYVQGTLQQKEYKEKGVITSGCSRHMTRNKCYLTKYEYYDGGFVSFGDGKGRISGKGKIKTGTLDFDNMYFCKELKYKLFSMSQICDKKNNVLFTDTECLVLSSDFKLLDESQVLLRVPIKDNIYSVDLKSVVPTKGLTCLFAKATIDESNLWHRRLGHIKFKNMNKLVRGTLLEVYPQRFLKIIILVLLVKKESNTKPHGIKREFSVARTPQQNGVAERRNRTLIKATRTMLVDSKFPTTFWAEAVNTACYVLNRVLVIKPHNKTPYELIRGRTSLIDFMKPFGCSGTILNTRDPLGKFDGKADERFFVGYSIVSKAMRVFNKRTRIVEETLNIRFLKNTPNVTGNVPDWLFDVDSLTISMNYVLVVARNQTNDKDGEDDQATISDTPVSTAGPSCTDDDPSSPVNAAEASNAFEEHLFERFSPFKNAFTLPPVSNVTPIDDTGCFGNAYDDEDVGVEADLNNLETTLNVSPIPTTRIDKDHPKDQIIGDFNSAIQTRRMTKISDEHAMVCYINKQRRTNHKDYQNCLFAYFLSQMEPKKVIQALEDPSWIEAMQEELLQFQLQKVWTLVNLPNGKRAIGTKWVFRNKKDERGIVVRNKARLVAQGYTQEEGIDYDEVFAPVARMEAIRLFLAYASFMTFIMYQMDVKCAFLYGTIKEGVYACQPPGFEDPRFPDKVYKAEKALYGLRQAPKACDGIHEIIDFLNANQIHYALTINPTIYTPCIEQFWATTKIKTVNGEHQIQALADKKKVIITESSIKSDLHLEDADGTDCLPTAIIFKELARMRRVTPLFATMMVQANQEEGVDSGIPTVSQQTSITIQPSTSKPQKKQSRKKQKKTNAVPHPSDSTTDVRNEESAPTHSNDLLLSGEDRLKLTDLMDMCTKLSERVLDLEHTKTAKAQEIINLKVRVKKLEKRAGLRTHKSKRLYKGRSDDVEIFDTGALIGNEVFAENDMIEKDQDVIPKEVSTAAPSTTAVPPPNITKVEITLAQTLTKLKSVKSKVVIQEPVQSTATIAPSTFPKAKGITFRDAGESTTRTPTLVSSSSIKDKGKIKMDEPEVPLKKKDQIAPDEEMARNLEAQIQAELIEEEMLTRKKEEEANIALIES
ncbi:retrovirus-related pol polyprotein from transposon TNT 1-94 [Tanacetum coccineum]|uniref:Retrovirus-related pol polyprotein from transposon TNT 1-94 n=1 Tax=Tanacetum coccineum TaxID=301880 RepID=A0ABQ4WVZ1_9ASTR